MIGLAIIINNLQIIKIYILSIFSNRISYFI